MPAAPRKGSLGNSRKQTQFREPGPAIGRKTGVRVPEVELNSDGLEDYGKVLAKMDTVSVKPSRPVKKKKRAPSPTPEPSEEEEEGEDENGEQSMEIDDSTPGTPLNYFHKRAPAPSSARRVGSALRPVARSPAVDYDRVPSPRRGESSRSHRKSVPRPSSLGRGSVGPEDFNQPDFGNEDMGGYGMDDYDEQPGGGNASFTELNQDDEEDQEMDLVAGHDLDRTPTRKSTGAMSYHQKSRHGKSKATTEDEAEERQATPVRSKSKSKAAPQREPSPDFGLEEGMVGGLAEEDTQQLYSDEEQEEEEAPPAKKARKNDSSKGKENADAARKPRAESKPRVEKAPYDGPLRRSRREPMPPLEFWRLEKRVYGRPDHGKTLVANVKEIIRIPKDPVVPLGQKNKRKRKAETPKPKTEYVNDPTDGWDDDTELKVDLVNFNTKVEENRRIVLKKKDVKYKKAADKQWSYCKAFGDDEFIAAGFLLIPTKCSKTTKQTKDNTYIFHVLQGAINLRLADRNLVLAAGATFMVPRGNQYHVENICGIDVKLFFTQARKMHPDDVDRLDGIRESRTPSTAISGAVSGGEEQEASADEEEEQEELPVTKSAGKKKAAPEKRKAPAVEVEDEEEGEGEEAPPTKKASKPASKAGSKPASNSGSKPASKAGSKPPSKAGSKSR